MNKTTPEEALRLALDALTESVDLVANELEDYKNLYSRYPSRATRMASMQEGLDNHRKAIERLADLIGEARGVDAEPVVYQYRNDPKYTDPWRAEWRNCSREEFDTMTDRSCINTRRLFTHPAPSQPAVPVELPVVACISAYAIPVSDKRYADEILVQRSRQIEGPPLWAVRLNGDCLNKSGEWEWEPMPSSRDDEFLDRCRFPTAQEAIQAAIAAGRKV